MKLMLARWVAVTAVVMLMQRLVPGVVVDSWGAATLFALGLGLVNALVTPLFEHIAKPVLLLLAFSLWVIVNTYLLHRVGGAIAGVAIRDFVTATAAALAVGAAVGFASITARRLTLGASR